MRISQVNQDINLTIQYVLLIFFYFCDGENKVYRCASLSVCAFYSFNVKSFVLSKI